MSVVEKNQIVWRLVCELRWNERHVEQSARIAVAKALWLGLEKDEVMQLIRTVPSATYLRQCPHILPQAWEAIEQVNEPSQQLDGFDQLPIAMN